MRYPSVWLRRWPEKNTITGLCWLIVCWVLPSAPVLTAAIGLCNDDDDDDDEADTAADHRRSLVWSA